MTLLRTSLVTGGNPLRERIMFSLFGDISLSEKGECEWGKAVCGERVASHVSQRHVVSPCALESGATGGSKILKITASHPPLLPTHRL